MRVPLTSREQTHWTQTSRHQLLIMSSLSAVAAAAAALSIHLQVTVLKGGQAKVLVTVPDNAPPHKRKYHSRGGGWVDE